MLVQVKVLAGGVSEREVDLPGDATYERLLRELGFNSEEYVVLRCGQSVPLDEKIVEGEGEIRVLRVVSGGSGGGGGENRSLLDKRCGRCGAWMELDPYKEGSVEVLSYFCPVCGLAYRVQDDD